MLLELKQTTTYAVNPFLLKFVTIHDYLFDIHDSDLEKIRWFDQKNKLSRDEVRAYNTRLQLCFYDPRNLIKEKLTVQGDFYTHTLPWNGVTIKILSKLKKVSSVLLSFLSKSGTTKDMNKQLWAQS